MVNTLVHAGPAGLDLAGRVYACGRLSYAFPTVSLCLRWFCYGRHRLLERLFAGSRAFRPQFGGWLLPAMWDALGRLAVQA